MQRIEIQATTELQPVKYQTWVNLFQTQISQIFGEMKFRVLPTGQTNGNPSFLLVLPKLYSLQGFKCTFSTLQELQQRVSFLLHGENHQYVSWNLEYDFFYNYSSQSSSNSRAKFHSSYSSSPSSPSSSPSYASPYRSDFSESISCSFHQGSYSQI